MYQDTVRDGRPIDLQIGPGKYGYYQVIEQWNAMLADVEVSEWGAPLILRLLDLVDGLEIKDDVMRVYETQEWAEIAARRGPADAGWQADCPNCGLSNIGFGTSGFVDECYTVNYESREVVWEALFPDGPPDRDESLCARCGTSLPEKCWGSVFASLKGFTVVRDLDRR